MRVKIFHHFRSCSIILYFLIAYTERNQAATVEERTPSNFDDGFPEITILHSNNQKFTIYRNAIKRECYIESIQTPNTTPNQQPNSRTLFLGNVKITSTHPIYKELGQDVLDFCKSFPLFTLEERFATGKPRRIKRQVTQQKKPYFKGQTQTQFISFDNEGKDDKGGTAEATAEQDKSRATVQGRLGMGQAQSQSGSGDPCEECAGSIRSGGNLGSTYPGGSFYPSQGSNAPQGVGESSQQGAFVPGQYGGLSYPQSPPSSSGAPGGGRNQEELARYPSGNQYPFGAQPGFPGTQQGSTLPAGSQSLGGGQNQPGSGTYPSSSDSRLGTSGTQSSLGSGQGSTSIYPQAGYPSTQNGAGGYFPQHYGPTQTGTLGSGGTQGGAGTYPQVYGQGAGQPGYVPQGTGNGLSPGGLQSGGQSNYSPQAGPGGGGSQGGAGTSVTGVPSFSYLPQQGYTPTAGVGSGGTPGAGGSLYPPGYGLQPGLGLGNPQGAGASYQQISGYTPGSGSLPGGISYPQGYVPQLGEGGLQRGAGGTSYTPQPGFVQQGAGVNNVISGSDASQGSGAYPQQGYIPQGGVAGGAYPQQGYPSQSNSGTYQPGLNPFQIGGIKYPQQSSSFPHSGGSYVPQITSGGQSGTGGAGYPQQFGQFPQSIGQTFQGANSQLGGQSRGDSVTGGGAYPQPGATTTQGGGTYPPGIGTYYQPGTTMVPGSGTYPQLPGSGTYPQPGTTTIPGGGTYPQSVPGGGTNPQIGVSTIPGGGTYSRPGATTTPGGGTYPQPVPGSGTYPQSGTTVVPGGGSYPQPGATTGSGGAGVYPQPGATAIPGSGTYPQPGATTIPGSGTYPQSVPGSGVYPQIGTTVPGGGGAFPQPGATTLPGGGAYPQIGGLGGSQNPGGISYPQPSGSNYPPGSSFIPQNIPTGQTNANYPGYYPYIPGAGASIPGGQSNQIQGGSKHVDISSGSQITPIDTASGESQSLSSLHINPNGTNAEASAQGKTRNGMAQAQVSGTYTGSFSAQAQTSDNEKSVQTQIFGNTTSASSSSQGKAGKSESQSQIQYNYNTGASLAESQGSGINYNTNTQIQAGNRGGIADAQSTGSGSTSSQAQIGFLPWDSKRKEQTALFEGGGTSSSQNSASSGQSQTQLHGSFRSGTSFTGSAQSSSGKAQNKTKLAFDSSDLSFSIDDTTKPPNSVGEQSAKQVTKKENSIVKSTVPLSSVPQNDQKDYVKNTAPNNESPQHQDAIIKSQKYDAYIDRDSSDMRTSFNAGDLVPGTNNYRIPTGFRGRVASTAGDSTHATATSLGHAQSQTVLLKPGKGRVTINNPNRSDQSNFQNDANLLINKRNDGFDEYVTVTKSETGELNGDKKFAHTYYTKSSTCGYFTFTCNYIDGSNGRTKICKPGPLTYSDGSPCS